MELPKSTFESELFREISVQWSIKGYIFEVPPSSEIHLHVVPEPDNKYDPFAMKVMGPENVSVELLDKITREGDGRRGPQEDRDIVGKQAGRVPANISKMFSCLFANRFVDKITCMYTGKAPPTIRPRTRQKF